MLQQNAHPPLPEYIRCRLSKYRTQLLSAGMKEPAAQDINNTHLRFYCPAAAQTTFVVNLTGGDEYIEVTYGYASRALPQMSDNTSAWTVYGISNDEITLRAYYCICDESEEADAAAQIRQMYHAYQHTEKEALLELAKARRKEFIQQIAVRLKPMGFRKKGNRWTCPLADGFLVHFEAQKSAWGDMYYFNIVIGKSSTPNCLECYYQRVAPPGMSPMDWQMIAPEAFDRFLDHAVLPKLAQVLHTPLPELGQQPGIWSGCVCDHRKCGRCWVEKNMWEAGQR